MRWRGAWSLPCTRREDSRACRSTSCAAPIPTGASRRSSPRRARTTPAPPSSSWPATVTGPTAPRPRRTTGFAPGSPRRCSRPADLVEVPLAVMAATLAEERYAGLSAAEAKPRVLSLLDWAAEHGGAFSILWHPERFDGPSARGWDRLYFELIEAVRERGGICLAAGELAGLAADRFGLPRD